MPYVLQCPRCGSIKIKEEMDSGLLVTWYFYRCQDCKHTWGEHHEP